MKKIILTIILAVAVVVFAASVDRRTIEPDNHPVFRAEVTQLVGDPNLSADISTTLNLNGTVRQITVGVSDNTGNKTATIDIIDDNGSVLFTTETVAENTTSAPIVQHFMTESATDLPLAVLITGTITINANLSGDVGASGIEIDVVLYGN